MDEIAFRKLVQETLDAQQIYFKSRLQSDLIKAKELEKQVRKELAAGPDPRTLVDGSEPSEQYTLFE